MKPFFTIIWNERDQYDQRFCRLSIEIALNISTSTYLTELMASIIIDPSAGCGVLPATKIFIIKTRQYLDYNLTFKFYLVWITELIRSVIRNYPNHNKAWHIYNVYMTHEHEHSHEDGTTHTHDHEKGKHHGREIEDWDTSHLIHTSSILFSSRQAVNYYNCHEKISENV